MFGTSYVIICLVKIPVLIVAKCSYASVEYHKAGWLVKITVLMLCCFVQREKLLCAESPKEVRLTVHKQSCEEVRLLKD